MPNASISRCAYASFSQNANLLRSFIYITQESHLLPCVIFQSPDSFREAPPKKKIGVFTVCRPTLFYSCRPYHFFSKNKKKDCCPTLLERSRILVLVFKFLLILFYSVCSQTFYGYLRILSIQDGGVLVAFRFKKCDHQDQKNWFEATGHHQMT